MSNERKAVESYLAGSVVKSAARVLKILEFFDNVQREANVVEICRVLGYPQSSTSMLLRTMVTLGYLQYNSAGRTYLTTSRVALSGTWVSRVLFQSGNIYRLFDEICELTGQDAAVAVRNGINAQYIYSTRANGRSAPRHNVGASYTLNTTGSGLVLLSTLSDAEARKIIRRLNSEVHSPDQWVACDDVMQRLGMIRAEGYALAADPAVSDSAEIAMPLLIGRGMPHAIAICGSYKALTANQMPLVDVLRQAIAAYHHDFLDREQSCVRRYAAKAQPFIHAPQFSDGAPQRLHGADRDFAVSSCPRPRARRVVHAVGG